MFWITAFTTLIAVLRFLFIIIGLWWTIQSLCDRFHLTCCSEERRRKGFLFVNIIYLLGLLPHSLLLFPSFSFESSPIYILSECDFSLGTRGSTVCWAQRLSCVLALVIHMLLCLSHAIQPLIKTLQSTRVLSIRKKVATVFAASLCTIALLWQGFYLWPSESNLRWKYFDVQKVPGSSQSECQYDIIMQPPLPVPRQVIQIQLLLCEERMSIGKAENYLFCNFLCGLPVVVFILAMRRLHKTHKPTENEEEIRLWTPEREYTCICTKDDPTFDHASNFMSLVISLWILLARPLVVAFSVLSNGYFVDYGTHLLLTLCVILPITFSRSQNDVAGSDPAIKSDLLFVSPRKCIKHSFLTEK